MTEDPTSCEDRKATRGLSFGNLKAYHRTLRVFRRSSSCRRRSEWSGCALEAERGRSAYRRAVQAPGRCPLRFPFTRPTTIPRTLALLRIADSELFSSAAISGIAFPAMDQ